MPEKWLKLQKESGADWIKFQTFSANNLLTKSSPKAEYQKNYDSVETQYEMIQRLAMNNEMHLELIDYCKKKILNSCQALLTLKALSIYNPLVYLL